MSSLPPINTTPLILPLHEALMELLNSLKPLEWEQQTNAPLWKVKDVAAHLLDGHLRALSIVRDGYFENSTTHFNSYQDLVAYLNALNASWVIAMKRVSPAVLVSMLSQSGPAYAALLASLPPHEKAIFGVAWAGEEASENWFHIAREYTEQWHHQQQIRLAVGQQSLLYTKKFYFPFLDTSMRALPHHYRSVQANPGDCIQFVVSGEGGGEWLLLFDGVKWELVTTLTHPLACVVNIEGNVAWQIFTKGIRKKEAEKYVRISGTVALGQPIFSMLAVMA
jgi:uncharacterized protein (TIGR03083 family)